MSNQLVLQNVGLVHAIAKRWSENNHEIPYEDCVQEGMIGLIKASRKYDGRGNFGIYAKYWIRQEIRLALFQKYKLIRIPQHWYDKVSSFRKAHEKLGSNASFEDVADYLGLTRLKRKNLKSVLRTMHMTQRWTQSK